MVCAYYIFKWYLKAFLESGDKAPIPSWWESWKLQVQQL